MKKLFASALLALSLSAPAFAWTGGPWSNGSALDGNENTVSYFQATVSGKNMIGLVEFTYSATPTSSNVISAGSALVFYQGWIYKATCGAFVDESSRKITGIFIEDEGAVGSFGDMHGFFQAKMTNTGASSTFSGKSKNCEMVFWVGQETVTVGDPDATTPTTETVDVYEQVNFKIRGSRTGRIANDAATSPP